MECDFRFDDDMEVRDAMDDFPLDPFDVVTWMEMVQLETIRTAIGMEMVNNDEMHSQIIL